jgi:hypothetical protein
MAGVPYTSKPVTDIFTADTDIDRRKCHRKVPMKVLALGLGRTGTASLRSALIELGFTDTYHMMSASVENPPDCIMWQDAFAAKYDGIGTFGREDWDQLLGHCQAICDWPAVAFAKELIEAYPDAKVVLNDRDIDSWYESTLKTVNWRATEPELKFVAQFDWGAGLYQPMLAKFWGMPFVHYIVSARTDIFRRGVLQERLSEIWQASFPRLLRRSAFVGPQRAPLGIQSLTRMGASL